MVIISAAEFLILGAHWWDAFSAIGTVGAVIVALAIPLFDYQRNRRTLKEQRNEARERSANLISAWVEQEYIPGGEGTRYEKVSVLKLTNQSDEPVYQVEVNIALGLPLRQIGALAVPNPIHTLPPRTERKWDVTAGLLAHDSLGGLSIALNEPVVRVSFTDSRTQRWHRDFDGELKKNSSENYQIPQEFTEEDVLQLGAPNVLNPAFVVVAFLNALRHKAGPQISEITNSLDPLVADWRQMTREDWVTVAKDLSKAAQPVHVHYRSPRVAYIRLVDEADLGGTVSKEDGTYLPMKAIVTLVFRKGLGWRIFTLGGAATAPEWIQFQNGETSSPIRSFLNDSTAEQ